MYHYPEVYSICYLLLLTFPRPQRHKDTKTPSFTKFNIEISLFYKIRPLPRPLPIAIGRGRMWLIKSILKKKGTIICVNLSLICDYLRLSFFNLRRSASIYRCMVINLVPLMMTSPVVVFVILYEQ